MPVVGAVLCPACCVPQRPSCRPSLASFSALLVGQTLLDDDLACHIAALFECDALLQYLNRCPPWRPLFGFPRFVCLIAVLVAHARQMLNGSFSDFSLLDNAFRLRSRTQHLHHLSGGANICYYIIGHPFP